VEREKQQCAELLTLSAGDVTSLDDDVRRLEDDNAELRRQLDVMDTRLTDEQHQHTDKYTHTHTHTHTQTHRRTGRPAGTLHLYNTIQYKNLSRAICN